MGILSYRILFSIEILHDYFLNRGEQIFDEMPEEERLRQLEDYHWGDFFDIIPTPMTIKKLKNHQLLLKKSNRFLMVLARNDPEELQESFVSLPEGLGLNFLINYKAPLFENFTEMPFLTQDRMFFINSTEDLENETDFQLIPVTEGNYFNEDYVYPLALTEEFLEGQDEKKLQEYKGLIHIKMIGESGDWNVTNVNGTLKVNPTVFRIHFRNRSTYWKYLHSATALELETISRKPLTKSGFVVIDPFTDFGEGHGSLDDYQFPNPGIRSLKRDEDKIISEIHL